MPTQPTDVRALIVAVQKYPVMRIPGVLRGTTRAAVDFATWLRKLKKVPAAGIYVCARGGAFPPGVRRFGVTKSAIKTAISELVADGRDRTREFYCFYSGHGFRAQVNAQDAGNAVLVPSDFVDETFSMDIPIGIEELKQRMLLWLGGDSHFYFIDACQTPLRGVVGVLGLQLDPASKGRRKAYRLASTVPGSAAQVDSGFAPVLLDGLRGNPGALQLIDGRVFVTLTQLAHFAEQALSRDLDAEGAGPGKILEIAAATPTHEIIAEQGGQRDRFLLELVRFDGQRHTVEFEGPRFLLQSPQGGSIAEVRLLSEDEEWLRARPAPPHRIDFTQPQRITFVRRRDDVPLAGISEEATRPAVNDWLRPMITANEDRFLTFAASSLLPLQMDDHASHGISPGASELRLVAFDESDDDAIGAAIVEGSALDWRRSIVGATRPHRFAFRNLRGSVLVALRFERGLTQTFATICRPDWLTVIAAYRNAKHQLTKAQVLMPCRASMPLDRFGTMVRLQWGSAKGADVPPDLMADGLDPVTALVLGRSSPEHTLSRDPDVWLPDLDALQEKTPLEGARGVPLLLSSVLRVPGLEDRLPFPPQLLDYGGIWTCWRGAVPPDG